MPAGTRRSVARRSAAILLVSLAGLLLEIGYTRIISYKLWYYYTYLVIGLSLLGIGSGGVLVAVVPALRRVRTDRIVAVSSLVGAAVIAAGYGFVARIGIDTIAVWDYGTRASFRNLAVLAAICFVVFAAFIALGVIVSVLLGRAGPEVGRLYFADLVGAALACLIAIPLITRLSPPRVIGLAALVFAAVGVASWRPRRSPVVALGLVLVAVLTVGVARDTTFPDVRVEDGKINATGAPFSEWGPVFRVDVLDFGPQYPNRLLAHDGNYGSGIWRWDGDPASLSRFETDARAIPFQVLGDAPERELIIGAAGGQEILTSLYFGAPDIEAVELNPVTVSILEDDFADYTGHLADRPEVDLHQGDGRSYLARSGGDYDLVWYVAPDSYAANNAASSGAFVLSESYLYTTEMIEETLEHLTDDGVMVAQFGELDFAQSPSRTARYLATAREALAASGATDPSRHLMVAASRSRDQGGLSTVVVKRTPFTDAEIDRFSAGVAQLPGDVPIYAPGRTFADFASHPVAAIARGTDAEAAAAIDAYPREVGPISDDAPFFWHFSSFRSVLSDIFEPVDVFDPEDVIGERVLLLLLGLAIVYAAVFLLLPFVAVRSQWRTFPAKRASAVYFAALGLGFMLYEITMIQRLTRFLGYPTYSLTVTLAAILLSTGIGALVSGRLASRVRHLVPALVVVLAALTVAYRFVLDPLTDSLLDTSLGVRVVVSLLLLAPLGLCLGMFMPLGLARVASMAEHGDQYVAWAWAVNGFFSVIGSVSTTILAMALGFRTVQVLACAVYVVAAFAFAALSSPAGSGTPAAAPPPRADPALDRSRSHRIPATTAMAASTASDGSATARKRVWP